MKARRIGGGLAAAGLFLLTSGAGALGEEPGVTLIPAPPGKADAVAVEVGPVKIGHASAEAGPSEGSATGNAVEVSGRPPASQFGSTAKKGEKQRNQVVELARADMGSVRVAPSEAESSGGANDTRSRSSAALLEVIGNGLFRIDVARGEANAEHDGKDSKASAVSDGARLYLGPKNELTLIVLHAESRSDATGETYLVGINGQKIGTNAQLNRCPLSIPQLADLGVNCVTASGGEGAIRQVSAEVARLKVLPAGGQGAGLSTTSSRSASGTSNVARAPIPEPLPEPADPGGLLPRTGAAFAPLALAGALLVALGGIVLAVGRRLPALATNQAR